MIRFLTMLKRPLIIIKANFVICMYLLVKSIYYILLVFVTLFSGQLFYSFFFFAWEDLSLSVFLPLCWKHLLMCLEMMTTFAYCMKREELSHIFL